MTEVKGISKLVMGKNEKVNFFRFWNENQGQLAGPTQVTGFGILINRLFLDGKENTKHKLSKRLSNRPTKHDLQQSLRSVIKQTQERVI